MRHTDFWARLEASLGTATYRFWADHQVLGELGGRTAAEALAAGESPAAVWRAVWSALELPDRDR
ncbi:MAG: DUF3046 domain-containing protein [Marmoricola sp.]